MSITKTEPLSEVWAARYDDRDDEDLACEMWARRLASREMAMAQPFKNFPMVEDAPDGADKPRTGTAEASHPR